VAAPLLLIDDSFDDLTGGLVVRFRGQQLIHARHRRTLNLLVDTAGQ
jgi:hypothetical protein